MTYSLIYNGTLIDGSGQQPVANAGVLIKGHEIESAGPLDRIAVPDTEVTKVDAQGGCIMPGFIDTHVHVMIEGMDMTRMMATPFSLNFYSAIGYLRHTIEAGVTSVRDAGGADLGVKQAVEQGMILGPRLQISITPLTITSGHGDFWTPSGIDFEAFVPFPGRPSNRCDGVEEVRKKVREVLRAGADVIKVCSSGGVMSPTDHPEFTQFTPEELSVMVQEGAYRRGVKVMAHAQGAEGVKNAVRAGIHSIEHGIYLDDETIELILEHGTYLVPTLLVGVAVLEMAETTKTIPEWALVKAREVVEIHKESISKAYRAGVRIAMGTDSGVMTHGINLRELGLMCDIGMTPMEAIVATTKTAAECLGWQDRVGTLQPAKLADIVISKTDPLADIRSLENVDNIIVVMKNGQIVKDRRS